MDKPINGTPKQVQVLQTVIQKQGGGKMILTTTEGQYIGSIDFEMANPGVLKAMGDAFQAFCAQQSGGLQIVSDVPGGLGVRN